MGELQTLKKSLPDMTTIVPQNKDAQNEWNISNINDKMKFAENDESNKLNTNAHSKQKKN